MSYEVENSNLRAELRQAYRLQGMHVEALRIVHEALGYPLRGQENKTCIDMARLAAEKIRSAA